MRMTVPRSTPKPRPAIAMVVSNAAVCVTGGTMAAGIRPNDRISIKPRKPVMNQGIISRKRGPNRDRDDAHDADDQDRAERHDRGGTDRSAEHHDRAFEDKFRADMDARVKAWTW